MRNIILLFGLCILTTCSNRTVINDDVQEKYEYSDIENYRIQKEEIFSIKLDIYSIYIYREDCSYCEKIKNDVIKYVQKNNDVFVIDNSISEIPITSRQNEIIGIDDISSLYIYGTPIMLIIKDKKISNVYLGVQEILTYINIKI